MVENFPFANFHILSNKMRFCISVLALVVVVISDNPNRNNANLRLRGEDSKNPVLVLANAQSGVEPLEKVTTTKIVKKAEVEENLEETFSSLLRNSKKLGDQQTPQLATTIQAVTKSEELLSQIVKKLNLNKVIFKYGKNNVAKFQNAIPACGDKITVEAIAAHFSSKCESVEEANKEIQEKGEVACPPLVDAIVSANKGLKQKETGVANKKEFETCYNDLQPHLQSIADPFDRPMTQFKVLALKLLIDLMIATSETCEDI